MKLDSSEFISVKTPIGHLSLGFSESRLVYVGTKRFDSYVKPFKEIHHCAQSQLCEYFYDGRQQFELPLFWSGTPFQEKAWKVLSAIPYGTTISYKEQAHMMGHNKAYRAVGGANGKNALMIVVPCHRVIASSGSLGGFSAGLNLKSWLLAHESSQQ